MQRVDVTTSLILQEFSSELANNIVIRYNVDSDIIDIIIRYSGYMSLY